MTEKNENELLLIKAAVYAGFTILVLQDESKRLKKFGSFNGYLNLCGQFGIYFNHINKLQNVQQNIDDFKTLVSILDSCIAKKEINSERYQDFFANANNFFQELKPYAEAYYEVKTKNLKLNKLGFYCTTGNQAVPKPAVVKTPQENAITSTQEHTKEKTNPIVPEKHSENRDLSSKVKTEVPKNSSGNSVKKMKPIDLDKKLKPVKKIANIKFNDFTDFSADSAELNIYIDEAWPWPGKDYNTFVPQNPDDKKTGVIAGIVWLGSETDPEILPKIGTHLREEIKPYSDTGKPIPEQIEKILMPPIQNLLNCKKAMPFIFPLNIESEIDWQNDYFPIFEAAIKILLGWVLPQNGKKCNVCIYPEHIGKFVDGRSKSEYFRGVLSQAMKNTGRFSRFNIKKVEWQDKEFGYIPYGDLLGYMTLPIYNSLVFKKMARCEELAGYLPISIGLFELLSRLDIIEETKNVDDIYNLIDSIYGTKIYNFIMSDLKKRLENNVELKTKILESIEAKYLAKNRDLRKLRWYFKEIMPFIESLEETADTVTKLMFTSVRLQDANHEGNPAKIEKYLADYDEKWAKAIQLREFEIAADCELHLAVHYNDMFQFDKAFETLKRNEKYFDYFKLPTVAKFYSSLGQNKSINKNFGEAKRWFDKALEEFNKSEDRNKALEIEQTSVYRLFNALEGNDPEYPKMFTGFFGTSPEIAAKFANENSVADQYKHHLLVRSLFSRNDLGEFKTAYLAEKKNWNFLPQHPWQLIEFYRAMLENDSEKSYVHMKNALAICENEEHGGVIYLIGAVIAAAGATKFTGDKKEDLQQKALEFVEKAENMRVAGKKTAMLSEKIKENIYLIGTVIATAGATKFTGAKKEFLQKKATEFAEKAESMRVAGSAAAMLSEKIKENCGIENILEILPFNYR